MTDSITTLSAREVAKITTLVTVNVVANPKKKGTQAWTRFEGYFTLVGECSIQDALDAGLRMDDIRHDSAHGFITLESDADRAQGTLPL